MEQPTEEIPSITFDDVHLVSRIRGGGDAVTTPTAREQPEQSHKGNSSQVLTHPTSARINMPTHSTTKGRNPPLLNGGKRFASFFPLRPEKLESLAPVLLLSIT
jgi:hypothetical protein